MLRELAAFRGGLLQFRVWEARAEAAEVRGLDPAGGGQQEFYVGDQEEIAGRGASESESLVRCSLERARPWREAGLIDGDAMVRPPRGQGSAGPSAAPVRSWDADLLPTWRILARDMADGAPVVGTIIRPAPEASTDGLLRPPERQPEEPQRPPQEGPPQRPPQQQEPRQQEPQRQPRPESKNGKEKDVKGSHEHEQRQQQRQEQDEQEDEKTVGAGVWDPLGLPKDGDVAAFHRRRTSGAKHGRICVLATLGFTAPELIVFPGYLIPSSSLTTTSKVPGVGWFRIIPYCFYCESGCFSDSGQSKIAPGDCGWQPQWRATDRPELIEIGLNAELAKGRLAMMAIFGMFFRGGLTEQTRQAYVRKEAYLLDATDATAARAAHSMSECASDPAASHASDSGAAPASGAESNTELKCDRLTSWGMDGDYLARFKEECGPCDSLRRRVCDDAGIASPQCESSEETRTEENKRRLIEELVAKIGSASVRALRQVCMGAGLSTKGGKAALARRVLLRGDPTSEIAR